MAAIAGLIPAISMHRANAFAIEMAARSRRFHVRRTRAIMARWIGG